MKVLQVRLSEEEHYKIKSDAIAARLTLTDYVKDLLLKGNPLAIPLEALSPAEAKRVVEPKIPEPAVIKTNRAVASEAMFPKSEGTCKNGHPAIRPGKCSAKGCKFSVYA
jgi:hypothetical protein